MSARASVNKYLPVLLFAICIVIAVILAWAMPPLWPAALAIAISGAALATALRLQSGTETAMLIDEITALQKSNDELRASVAKTHSMIDELADVVEQVATFTVDGGGEVSQEQIDSLRDEMARLRAQPAPVPVDDRMEARLAAIETRLAAAALPVAASAPDFMDQRGPEPEPVPSEDTGRLRSLISRGEQRDDAAAPSSPAESETAPRHASSARSTLTPVFAPTLGAPVAFVLSAAETDTPETVPGLLRHAVQVAAELQEADRDVRLFLRLSSDTLSNEDVGRDILAAVETDAALRACLVPLTPQDGFDRGVRRTLTAIADRGCKFALEDVRDWSLDLGDLAQAGLGFIAVDGIAMAQSAAEQGGDPRRLAQALLAHGIDLIAGGVYVREDIDTVRTLEPVLVMGDGLGIPRALDTAT